MAESRHRVAGGTVRISITDAGGPRDKLQTTLLRTQRFRRSLQPLCSVSHLYLEVCTRLYLHCDTYRLCIECKLYPFRPFQIQVCQSCEIIPL